MGQDIAIIKGMETRVSKNGGKIETKSIQDKMDQVDSIKSANDSIMVKVESLFDNLFGEGNVTIKNAPEIVSRVCRCD